MRERFLLQTKVLHLTSNTLVLAFDAAWKSYPQVTHRVVDDFVDNRSVNNDIILRNFGLNPRPIIPFILV